MRRRTTSLVSAAALLSVTFATAAAGSEQRAQSNADATVLVLVNGAAHGKVTSSPRGIVCGARCSSRFEEGARVVVRAAAVKDSRFRGWSGACVGKSKLCTLVVHGRQVVRAKFSPRGLFEDVGEIAYTRPVLNVTRAGPQGRITSSPGGIACPPTEKCFKRFDRGDQVTLTAVAPPGHEFVGWSGLLIACPGQRACTIRMNATTDVTATFSRS